MKMKSIILIIIILITMYLLINTEKYTNYIRFPYSLKNMELVTGTNCKAECDNKKTCAAYKVIQNECYLYNEEINKNDLFINNDKHMLNIKICEQKKYTLPPKVSSQKLIPSSTDESTDESTDDSTDDSTIIKHTLPPEKIDLGNYCNSSEYNYESCPVLSKLCNK